MTRTRLVFSIAWDVTKIVFLLLFVVYLFLPR